MKKLIINADDYGYTPGVTHGIIEAHNRGIVTSTTALSVAEHFQEAMRLLPDLAPTLAVGLHLTLTLKGAKPILSPEKVPSLIDENGYFWGQGQFADKVDLDEVYEEWDAQINEFFKSGHRPDHMDSHHNVHGKNEGLLQVALKLSRKYDIPLRNASRDRDTDYYRELYGEVPTPDKMMPDLYDHANLETLIPLLDEIAQSDKEIFEINCHPAFIENEIKHLSSYCFQRLDDLGLVTSSAALDEIKKRNILLVNYAAVRK